MTSKSVKIAVKISTLRSRGNLHRGSLIYHFTKIEVTGFTNFVLPADGGMYNAN